jgi:hypothetical protein
MSISDHLHDGNLLVVRWYSVPACVMKGLQLTDVMYKLEY